MDELILFSSLSRTSYALIDSLHITLSWVIRRVSTGISTTRRHLGLLRMDGHWDGRVIHSSLLNDTFARRESHLNAPWASHDVGALLWAWPMKVFCELRLSMPTAIVRSAYMTSPEVTAMEDLHCQ